MKTARQQVLNTVRSQRIVTASEISRTMQMTQANARHHLNVLVEQGLVAVVGLRPVQGKGRPEKLYGLSMQAAGHNLNWLAGALLDVLMEREVDSPDETAPEHLAKRLLSDAEQALPEEFELKDLQKYHLTQRLFQAVQIFNHYYYEAHWEAHASAPHFILGQCPYAAIIDRHPELCIMDRLAVERLAGMPVEQTAKRQPDNRGLRQCIFIMKRSNLQK
jgi:predicted ArsR family transcriptional regulator